MMKTKLANSFETSKNSFNGFSAGQKMVTLIGGGALLIAVFLVFKWASAPTYVPLYSNLGSEDAAAIVEQLSADGVSYELSGNGSTILVPQEVMYDTRVSLAGKGLPEGSNSEGYSLLDNQSLATSKFQEQTAFKRAMEGELATTVEAMDGVSTAVVHLALPEKTVFTKEQEPTTASVLLDLTPGSTFQDEQAQAVVHLVASSVEGLDPSNVTITDSKGQLLSGAGVEATSGNGSQTEKYQQTVEAQVQTMLDQVVGVGNSTVAVTANLDFDKSTVTSTDYTQNKDGVRASSTEKETYEGANNGGASGVVGPDGQMDGGAANSGSGKYNKSKTVEDNALDVTTEIRESAPGKLTSLHAAVVIDTEAAQSVSPADVEALVAAGLGLDPQRGDTVQVSALPFNRAGQEEAAAQIEQAQKAEAAAARNKMYREAGLGGLILALVAGAWWQGRKRSKQRATATAYVVEQIKAESDRSAAIAQAEAAAAVQASSSNLLAIQEPDEAEQLKTELKSLIEKQPEEVAAMLRGWLVER